MAIIPDYSLFPNKEEWGTGDEAMDNKLSSALKKVKEDLTLKSIREFYNYGLSLKPRAYNPAFHTTIELVTKAFLYCFDSQEYSNHLIQKMKGNYDNKKKCNFEFPNIDEILYELRTKKSYRYKGQIDFYINRVDATERNPYVRHPLKRSPIDLHVKIIMKDFKSYLNGENKNMTYKDSFFDQLKNKDQILIIKNLGEVWYNEGQIFSLLTSVI